MVIFVIKAVNLLRAPHKFLWRKTSLPPPCSLQGTLEANTHAEHRGIISFNYGWYGCLLKVEGLHAARTGDGTCSAFARPEERGLWLWVCDRNHCRPQTPGTTPQPGQVHCGHHTLIPKHGHAHSRAHTHTHTQLHLPHPSTILPKFNHHKHPYYSIIHIH